MLLYRTHKTQRNFGFPSDIDTVRELAARRHLSLGAGLHGGLLTMRMQQSYADFEAAWEYEAARDRSRRHQLRQRAATRSRVRRIQRVESRGRVRFSVLFLALALTVVTVTIIMFETLAMLMG